MIRIQLRRWLAKGRTRRARSWRLNRFDKWREEFGVRAVVLPVERFGGVFEFPASSDVLREEIAAGFEVEAVKALLPRVPRVGDGVDVGANAGLFSVLFSRHLPDGRILAVEPDPGILPTLHRNLSRNGAANVEVVEKALSSTTGAAQLVSAPGHEEYSSVLGLRHDATLELKAIQVRVALATLDTLVEERNLEVSVVKIDVEGVEGLVLEGGTQTLRRFSPTLLVEVDDRLLPGAGWSSQRLFRLLSSEGYAVVWANNLARRRARKKGTFIGQIVAARV